MEKIETVTTTKKVVHRYCDDCGAELHWSLQCEKAACNFCGKYLCKKCIAHERPAPGDYREVYCKTCSGIYKKHEPEILKARLSYRATLDTMRNECDTALAQHIARGGGYCEGEI